MSDLDSNAKSDNLCTNFMPSLSLGIPSVARLMTEPTLQDD